MLSRKDEFHQPKITENMRERKEKKYEMGGWGLRERERRERERER